MYGAKQEAKKHERARAGVGRAAAAAATPLGAWLKSKTKIKEKLHHCFWLVWQGPRELGGAQGATTAFRWHSDVPTQGAKKSKKRKGICSA